MYTACARRAGPPAKARKAAEEPARSSARCRSDRSSTGFKAGGGAVPSRGRLLLCAGDHDVVLRHVLVESRGSGSDGGDAIDDRRSVDDATEHAVAVALRTRTLVVEERVVGDVDEELRRCRMWLRRACH